MWNAAVAHGGGPTAVLNASLAGLVSGCRGRFGSLYGCQFGLTGDMHDLLQVPSETMDRIALAPGSAIGSSRARLEPGDFERLIASFRRRDIRVLFYTGGNGSMRTALEVERFARAAGFELQVLGIPKTIDNDLAETHHTPGYASTAYFFACAARDIGMDNRALPSPICILETLGRNAGWIVAATALARRGPDDAPHLIYFPERRVGFDRMAADVESVYRRLGRVVVAVCEGQLDDGGRAFGADLDRPGVPAYALASNLGHTLAGRLSAALGIRARAERPGLLGRSCGPFARERDRREAFACGHAAAEGALANRSGEMAALTEDGGTFFVPLERVAGKERLLPAPFLDDAAAFAGYAGPLVGEVGSYARFA